MSSKFIKIKGRYIAAKKLGATSITNNFSPIKSKILKISVNKSRIYIILVFLILTICKNLIIKTMTNIAEFNDKKGFNVKLTADKIYISAIGNEETFALRSLNGLGLYDDVEKYNKEDQIYQEGLKKKKRGYISLLVLGVLFLVIGLIASINKGEDAVGGIVEGIGFIVVALLMKKKIPTKPTLDSYFRIMLSGGSREFKFDKNEENSADVANFVNKVEDTLTAYNK